MALTIGKFFTRKPMNQRLISSNLSVERNLNHMVVSILIDISLLAIIQVVASAMRFSLPLGPDLPHVHQWPTYIRILSIIVWIALFAQENIYNPTVRMHPIDEYRRIISGSIIALLVISGILYFTERQTSRYLMLYFFSVGGASLLGWRIISRWIGVRRFAKQLDTYRIVLVSDAEEYATKIRTSLNNHNEIGISVKHCLVFDFFDKEQVVTSLVTALNQILHLEPIDEIVIATSTVNHKILEITIRELQRFPSQISIVSEYSRYALVRAKSVQIGSTSLIRLRRNVLSGYQRLIKRLFDIIVSSVMLVMLSPIMFLVGCLIACTSRGPIIFKQVRVGEGCREFTMYKFRTMVDNAENHVDLTTFKKTPNDPTTMRILLFQR